MVNLKNLIEAGVHFGHQTSRWCPKMAPYIWGSKNDIHLIDVSKTAYQLEKAARFLEHMVMEGKSIMWVGTKKPAQEIIKRAAQEARSPYVVHRWIGGTLTNYSQVKKSITKLLHYEDVLAKAEQSHYTKKELLLFQKKAYRLRENVGGIKGFAWPIGALVLVDVRKEQSALREAVSLNIPVVALVDTNSDPSMVDYVIPANDDAPKSIKVVIDYLMEVVKHAQQKAGDKGVAQAVVEIIAPEEQLVALVEVEGEEGSVRTKKSKDASASIKHEDSSAQASDEKKKTV